MANLKVEGLRGSEVLKIKAAVVEVMENAAGISITEDPDIKHDAVKGLCQMSFKKKDTTLSELSKIKMKLGERFDIEINHGKDAMQIILNAPTEAFTRLIGKEMPVMQKPAPGNGQEGDSQTGEGAK